jgi:hypothetical protein
MTDLWPTDIGTVTTKSPLTILKEQASLLGAKTKNIVKARVQRTKPAITPVKPFNYEFTLNAPALDNYSYRLFGVAYDVDLYPVRFWVDRAIAEEIGVKPPEELSETGEQKPTKKRRINRDESLIARREEKLIEILARILGSQKTRHIIHAILSQSTDLVETDGVSSA